MTQAPLVDSKSSPVFGAIWLIAEREFRTYTTTASFWIALIVGPLIMAGAAAMGGLSAAPQAPVIVTVTGPDFSLAQKASSAVREAVGLEGRRIQTAAPGAAQAVLDVVRAPGGGLEARFTPDFPLSPSGRALVARTLERDEALSVQPISAARVAALNVRPVTLKSKALVDTGMISRFTLVMILWITLTGSLGMLLQAVVRERANRALEGLLAAATPWRIVAGKLVGVGGVSLLVLIAWLVSAGSLAAFSSLEGGLMQAAIGGLSDTATLVRAVVIYTLAYAFFGLVTVAVGASAGDSTAAQNLSRPMFAVLLAVFFVAVGAVSGHAGQLAWLVYAPPFTPFMLLLLGPGGLPVTAELAALSALTLATVAAGFLAIGQLKLSREATSRRGA